MKLRFMDDGVGKIKIIPDHFNASASSSDSLQNGISSVLRPRADNSLRYFFLKERRYNIGFGGCEFISVFTFNWCSIGHLIAVCGLGEK